jgi:hypothetical protein
MSLLHQIEGLMTLAFMLYVIAYFMAKRKNKKHKIIALIGFFMDMYGTYLMFVISNGAMFSGYLYSDIHTVLSLIAFFLFFIQAMLGIFKKINYHMAFAKYVFFPVWILSFISGVFIVH